MISTFVASQRTLFRVASWVAVLLCAVFATLLQEPFAQHTREVASAIGLTVAGLFAVLSGVLRVRRTHGPRRRPWQLLVAAAVVGAAGNTWSAAVGADPVHDPSMIGEATIGAGLLLSIAALLNFPAMRPRGVERVLLILDGLVVGGAALSIAAVLVYAELLDSTTASLAARSAILVYPVLDVVLVTVAILLVVRSGQDRAVLSTLAIGFMLYAAADLSFAVLSAQDKFAFGTPLDLLWIGGYLVLALAAWHPDPVENPSAAGIDKNFDVQGTVLVYVMLLGSVIVQVSFGSQDALSRAQSAVWLVLVLAAGGRQTLLTIDNVALRRGLECRVRDQTADLRRLVRQTEVLLSSVGDGIYGVDPAGRITFINPSGAQALGYSSEELLGRSAHDVFHGTGSDGNPSPASKCYIAEAIESGAVASAEEDLYVRADGGTFPVEITSSPLVDERRVTGAVVVFRDVTQRHEVDRMKNEFLSVVSHELRTPLTSIRGSLGLLSGGALGDMTPQAERMTAVALESSERLTRLINDILDIERMESGTMPMELAVQDAAVLLRASAADISGMAGAADVRVEVGEATGAVIADHDRIVQTLANLLGNAIKFSPAGASVRLTAAPVGAEVVFRVEDTGRGIPAEKLATVFERFEQVDSSDARQKGGTGLGLTISRGIVEQHGGRIWVESIEGQGTTVSFSLPLAGSPPAYDARHRASVPEPSPTL